MSIQELIERVEAAREPNNALDVEIDIALFEPDRKHRAVRANAAGTKLVYTRHDGRTDTYWSQDHTLNAARKSVAIGRLRAIQSREPTT